MTDYNPAPLVVNSNPLPSILTGVARSILIAAGGVLVQKGYVDDQGLATLVGGLLSVGGVVWVGVLNWKNTRKKVDLAQARPSEVEVK